MLMLFTRLYFHGDILAPAFVFTVSFLFSALWLLPFVKTWNVTLHANTFWVVIGGVATFTFFCVLQSNIRFKRISLSNIFELKQINIKKWKMIVFLIIAAFTIFYSLYIKLRFAGGSFATLFATMSAYRANILFYGGDSVLFPKWLNLLNSTVTASGYWFSYILANNYVLNKKIEKLPLIIFILSVMNTVVSTSRGGTIVYLIAFITYFIMLYRIKANKKHSVKISTLLKIAGVLIILVITFQALGNVIGRGSNETTADYLARYCGAEIANLDSFLQHERPQNEIWGSQSFIYVIRWIGSKIGVEKSLYGLDLPFRFEGGKNLGNVYTTFYPYIYDFGYAGVFFMTALMAIISQGVYKNSLTTKFDFKPSRYILTYGAILPTIILSFFSNKFYESIFNPSFLYTFFFWVIFEYLFCEKCQKRIKIF